jgi:hypothetical protein
VTFCLWLGLLGACTRRTDARPELRAAESTALNPSADSELDSEQPDVNRGTQTTLRAGWAGGSERSALLAFDLSSIPAGSTVTSATLGLYHKDMLDTYAAFGAQAYRVVRAWTEAGATWSSASAGVAWGTAGCKNTSSDRAATSEYTVTVSTSTRSGYVTWTVTSLVQAWVDGSYANQGLLLACSSCSSTGAEFYTRDNASNKPRLYVAYNAPTATPTPTHTPTSTPTRTPTATPTPTFIPQGPATPAPTPLCPVQIEADMTWGPGLVNVGCNVGMAEGVTLTLAAGTTVHMGGDYQVDVLGTLYAAGTAASPITFTHAVSEAAGAWGYVYLRGPLGACTLVLTLCR